MTILDGIHFLLSKIVWASSFRLQSIRVYQLFSLTKSIEMQKDNKWPKNGWKWNYPIWTVFCLRLSSSYKFDDISIWNVYYNARRCLMSVECFFYVVRWRYRLNVCDILFSFGWFSCQLTSAGSYFSFGFVSGFFFHTLSDWSALKNFRCYRCLFFHTLWLFPFCVFFFLLLFSRICFVLFCLFFYWTVFFFLRILWSLVNWLEL